MPLQLDFSDRSTLFVHASGNVTYAEVQRAFADVVKSPGNSDMHVLADAREVTDLPSASDLRSLARELKKLFGRNTGSIAIVSPRPQGTGVGRTFGAIAQRVSVNVRAFRGMDEARRWLSAHRPSDVG